MTHFSPAHRGPPNIRRRLVKQMRKEDIFKNTGDDVSVDDSPRQLLAMGAVLDHLCRGGQLSDSTRVFMKEASRGLRRRRQPDAEALPDAPGLQAAHLSCLSSFCSYPPADSFRMRYNFRDDDDVDDGFTIPTVALRRFKEDYRDGEDFTLSLEDLTLDEATIETLDEDATFQMVDFDAVVHASSRVWKDLSPQGKIRVDPGFLERYVDENDVDEEILGAIALNVAKVEENLQDLVADPHGGEVMSAAVLFGLDLDDEDNKSVNSLAKKMHGMLQRRSSRLFATSDVKGNGHRAVVVRRRMPNKKTTPRPYCHFSMSNEDDDLTFAERKSDGEKEDPSIGPSTNTNSVSVLANAPNLPWPPSFPTSRNFQCKITTSESPQEHFSGVSFVSHDNNVPDSAATAASRTTTSQTLVRGNGNARRYGNSRNRLLFMARSLSDGQNELKAKARADSTIVSSLSLPLSHGRSVAAHSLASSSSRHAFPRPPVSPRKGSLLKRIKCISCKHLHGQPKEEGILAPLRRHERLGRAEF